MKKTASVSTPIVKSDKSKAEQTKPIHKRKKYQVCEVLTKLKGLKLKFEYVEIITDNNKKKLIQAAFDEVNNIAYVNKKIYTPEAIACIRKMLE